MIPTTKATILFLTFSFFSALAVPFTPTDKETWSEHERELSSIIQDQHLEPTNRLLNKALAYAKEAMANDGLAPEIRRFAFDLSIIATNATAYKKYRDTIKAFEQFPELTLPAVASLQQKIFRGDVIMIARAIICKMLNVPLSLERLTGPGLWVIEQENNMFKDHHFAQRQPIIDALTDTECAEIIKLASQAHELNKRGNIQNAMVQLMQIFNHLFNMPPTAMEVSKQYRSLSRV